jgi:hypothetical protein
MTRMITDQYPKPFDEFFHIPQLRKPIRKKKELGLELDLHIANRVANNVDQLSKSLRS